MDIEPKGATDCLTSVTFDVAVFPSENVCKAGGTFTAWPGYCCSGDLASGLVGECSYLWRGEPCPADGACASGYCVNNQCAFPTSCPAAGTALCTECRGELAGCNSDAVCCSDSCIGGPSSQFKYCSKPTATRPPESVPKCTAPACGTWVGAVLGANTSVSIQATESASGSTHDLKIVSPSTGNPYVMVDGYYDGDLDVGTGPFVARAGTYGYRGIVHPDGTSLTRFTIPE
jgi:hypothetical protein